jgi:hypothetical protein
MTMSKLNTEEIENFIAELADGFDYTLEDNCPDDDELKRLRDVMFETRQKVIARAEVLASQHDVEDATKENLHDLKEAWSRGPLPDAN